MLTLQQKYPYTVAISWATMKIDALDEIDSWLKFQFSETHDYMAAMTEHYFFAPGSIGFRDKDIALLFKLAFA